MTAISDEARKYVDLYKKSMDNYDTEGSITYGLRAENILEIMEDMARNEGEVKEVESLANEMIKSFEDHTHFHMLVDEEFETEIKRFMEDKIGNKSKKYYNEVEIKLTDN